MVLDIYFCTIKSYFKILKINKKVTFVLVDKFITYIPNSFISYLKAYTLLWDPLKFDDDGWSLGSCFKFTVIIWERWDCEVVELYLNIGAVILNS
jgi:hypothetical protein